MIFLTTMHWGMYKTGVIIVDADKIKRLHAKFLFSTICLSLFLGVLFLLLFLVHMFRGQVGEYMPKYLEILMVVEIVTVVIIEIDLVIEKYLRNSKNQKMVEKLFEGEEDE